MRVMPVVAVKKPKPSRSAELLSQQIAKGILKQIVTKAIKIGVQSQINKRLPFYSSHLTQMQETAVVNGYSIQADYHSQRQRKEFEPAALATQNLRPSAVNIRSRQIRRNIPVGRNKQFHSKLRAQKPRVVKLGPAQVSLEDPVREDLIEAELRKQQETKEKERQLRTDASKCKFACVNITEEERFKSKNKTKTLTYDFDGTLINSQRVHPRHLKPVHIQINSLCKTQNSFVLEHLFKGINQEFLKPIFATPADCNKPYSHSDAFCIEEVVPGEEVVIQIGEVKRVGSHRSRINPAFLGKQSLTEAELQNCTIQMKDYKQFVKMGRLRFVSREEKGLKIDLKATLDTGRVDLPSKRTAGTATSNSNSRQGAVKVVQGIDMQQFMNEEDDRMVESLCSRGVQLQIVGEELTVHDRFNRSLLKSSELQRKFSETACRMPVAFRAMKGRLKS